MSEKSEDAPASADDLYRQAEELIRRARAKLAEVRLAGRDASPRDSLPDLVDFDALPGRSPRARAEALYMGRRIRDDMFAPGLFGEFAWDILLELFLVRRDAEELPVDTLCRFAPAFRKTIGRTIAWMTELGLVEARTDPSDPGRERASLSQQGRGLMANFFELTDGQVPGKPISAPGLRLVSSEGADDL